MSSDDSIRGYVFVPAPLVWRVTPCPHTPSLRAASCIRCAVHYFAAVWSAWTGTRDEFIVMLFGLPTHDVAKLVGAGANDCADGIQLQQFIEPLLVPECISGTRVVHEQLITQVVFHALFRDARDESNPFASVLLKMDALRDARETVTRNERGDPTRN